MATEIKKWNTPIKRTTTKDQKSTPRNIVIPNLEAEKIDQKQNH